MLENTKNLINELKPEYSQLQKIAVIDNAIGKKSVYVYIDTDETGKKFYFADKEKGQFMELPQNEFIQQFECYEQDLEKCNRIKTMGNRRTNRRRHRFIKNLR